MGRPTGTSTASLDKVRAIWKKNVFGKLAVNQAMLPSLRLSADARIVNVGSGAGSLTVNLTPLSHTGKGSAPLKRVQKTPLMTLLCR